MTANLPRPAERRALSGVRLAQGAAAGRGSSLAATVSAEEVGAHLGLGAKAVWTLRRLGDSYGHELHPARGGLWGSFKSGPRRRRYTVESVERHVDHLRRLGSEPAFVIKQAARAARLGLEADAAHLDATAARMMGRRSIAA